MSWITIVWSMAASACITLAMVHLVIWFKQTALLAHLLFSVTAISVAAIAAGELLIMHAKTTEQFGRAVWWTHLPVFCAVVSIVAFVRLYLHSGRPWLGYAVCGLRLLALIINFFSVPNLNYKEITGLRRLTVLGGESISVAQGVPNPWTRVGELSSLLLLVFVVDASVTLWRRGDRAERRRALLVGGSMTFCILASAGHSALVNAGLIQSPYLISFPFLAVVAAMGYELSLDVLSATQLAQQLQASEIALRESEDNMSLAASAANLAMWRWDIPRDDIWISEEGYTLLGFAKSDKINLDRFLNALRPEDRETIRRAVDNAVTGKGEYESEFRVVLANGQVRWIAARGRVEFKDGKPLRTRGALLDLTWRKRAELEAARQRNELAHLSRVTLLGELSGSLAHELNQPLTAILSNAQAAQRFLAQDAVDPAELREILNDIVEEDKRAVEVIRHLRLLLKKGEGQFQPLNLNEVVRNVLRLIHSDLVNQNVAVHAELAVDLPVVQGDSVQLQQVLLNLVVNGCDALAGIAGAERTLFVRTKLTEDQCTRVSVADQGCGIPPEKMERIFEPFFTTKVQGMGLGLAICRTIITAHGGRLWGTNNMERGATFHFTLPTALSSLT
jgi:two-component system sensor kinase FixL